MNPTEILFENTLAFAQQLDAEDQLAHFQDHFYIPRHESGIPVTYFCGNSLGLQPKSVRRAIESELLTWEDYGVEGHFKGYRPWLTYHKDLSAKLAKLAGAKEQEIVAMNALTVNLHLLLVSFYRPTKQRFKIIAEAGAFPSDQYALDSQIRFHGFDPKESLIELSPLEGEYCLRTEDILAAIHKHRDSLALVMMGGVNYYTGQFFYLQKITKAGHDAGALVGFDLAHAIGNVVLELHDWDVDFATWCSYKYLNSGPGGVSGIFVNERFANDREVPRFAGWWGHQENVRFKMESNFQPSEGASGWQLSNAPVISMAVHRAALEVFEKTSMEAVRAKSELLTSYLIFLLNDNGLLKSGKVKLITPTDVKERGSQLSFLVEKNGREIFSLLEKEGVIADWREPNVIRVAPVPLYNTFQDVYRFASLFSETVNSLKA